MEVFSVKHTFFSFFSALFVISLIYFLNCTHDTGIPFNEQTYHVVLKSVGGGAFSIDNDIVSIKAGDTVTIVAYSDSSTIFDKWTYGSSITPLHNLSDSIISFTAHDDDTLVAWFNVKRFTVTVASSNTNYGIVTPASPKTVSYNGTLPILLFTLDSSFFSCQNDVPRGFCWHAFL